MHQRRPSEINTLVLLGVIFGTLLISGCTGARYGLATKNWHELSYEQKQTMAKNYRHIATVRAKEKREQDRRVITSTTPKIELYVKGGEALMPPFDKTYAFQSVSMIVYDGHCRSVALVQKAGKKKTNLEACYLDKVLYLDPSKYVYQWHQGSLRFNYMPIWDSESGFRYSNISSQGYAGLKESTIIIKSLIPPKT